MFDAGRYLAQILRLGGMEERIIETLTLRSRYHGVDLLLYGRLYPDSGCRVDVSPRFNWPVLLLWMPACPKAGVDSRTRILCMCSARTAAHSQDSNIDLG